MARTGSDFGTSAPQEKISVLSDLAEHAARLLSPVMFNRSGTVFFIDDFERTELLWTKTGDVGGDAVISTASAYTGYRSCKISTADGANKYEKIYKRFFYPTDQKIALSFTFQLENSPDYILATIEAGDETNAYKAEIKIDRLNQKLQYLDSDGNYQDIVTNLQISEDWFFFHFFKLIIDLKTGKYIKLIFDSAEYDLSNYSLRAWDMEDEVVMIPTIYVESRLAGISSIYVDNIIFTNNET